MLKLLVLPCQLQLLGKCWLCLWGQAEQVLTNGSKNALGDSPCASVSQQLGAALLCSSPVSLASSLLPTRSLQILTWETVKPTFTVAVFPVSKPGPYTVPTYLLCCSHLIYFAISLLREQLQEISLLAWMHHLKELLQITAQSLLPPVWLWRTCWAPQKFFCVLY